MENKRKLSYLKEFVEFGQETEVKPTTTPKPKTPTTPKPRRRSIPTERPSEEDAPLAEVGDVVDRFEDIYKDLPKEEKEKIDTYFTEE